MSLYIGNTAPDFSAETTLGPIRFHTWIGPCWAILFSHPRDFTPVCTTELAALAHMRGAFKLRGTKIIALSVDELSDHHRWASEVEATLGVFPDFPIIADPERRIARLYDMIPPGGEDTQTARSVFLIDPQKVVRATLTYPASTGRNFDEILRLLDALRLTDTYQVATPANWSDGEDVVILPSLTDPDHVRALLPHGVRELRPWLRLTGQPGR